MKTRTSLLTALPLLAALALVGGCPSEDLTSDLVGTYVGALASPVVDAAYTVTVTAVDNDTIEIAGADWDAFQVDVMGEPGSVTSLADDEENALTLDGDSLEIVHTTSDLTVNFAGDRDGATGDDDDDATGDDDDDATGDDDDDDDDDAATGPAAEAAGDFSGIISGPINDVDYSVTLTVVDVDTIEISGADFDSFEVPLDYDGTDIEANSWSDGDFLLEGDALSFNHTPQGLSFTGDRD